MKDAGIPRQAQWQRHCWSWLCNASTATWHKEKSECYKKGGDQRRKGVMVREGKQKGEWTMSGSVLLCSPPVQPKAEVQGHAVPAQGAGNRFLQSSQHCTSLSSGCDLCSDAENLQTEYFLHLLTSATSKLPSLTSLCWLTSQSQCRRPMVSSCATTCAPTSFSL